MDSGTRLFVGNLPETISDQDLRGEFSSFGKITNVEIKTKANDEDSKKFAFITLQASNSNIESCIKHFSLEGFNGSKLYVTRARESFLERLQRERQEALQKETAKLNSANKASLPKKQPVMKVNENLNPRKRKFANTNIEDSMIKNSKCDSRSLQVSQVKINSHVEISEQDKKKHEADKKRLESIARKRQDFKEKQKIIRTGLESIDKVKNKKVVFADDLHDKLRSSTVPFAGDETNSQLKDKNQPLVSTTKQIVNKKSDLFDDDDNSDEVNFNIKPQYEGRKGQKVLELQSKFKSDKRFMLDERFIDDEQSDSEKPDVYGMAEEAIVASQADEKDKQLNILQDVLGIAIKSSAPKPETSQDKKKPITKLGMLRFDPLQPAHSKFLAPVEENKEPAKKTKKKKNKDKLEEVTPLPEPTRQIEKVEVSKEQFYKVTDTLKEAIVQPNSFSLRSLFNREHEEDNNIESLPAPEYIPLQKQKDTKVKNPFDPGDKNPFKYDSSDSEEEESEVPAAATDSQPEVKSVWRENLFFLKHDQRLKEGLEFFNKKPEEPQIERRELKSVMKKRLYNKGRKEQMFKKKIGGKRKSHKKSFRRKNN